MQYHLADPDYDPRRRSYLAFARLVGRFLLYGDLGVISALDQHQLAALMMDRRRRTFLAFAFLVCRPLRFGDLDAAIRLIAGGSDGRQWWPRSHVDRAGNRRQL
jgi:hypothetical protein